MRSFIVRLVGTALAFYVTDSLIGGFTIEKTWQALLVASIVFIVINALIKPIIKLLLLPINLLTLGLFHWLVNVIVLYIFDFLYAGVTISGYQFEGYSSRLLNLPQMDLSLFWTLVLSSITISVFYSVYGLLFNAD